jgi:hypothetical protein
MLFNMMNIIIDRALPMIEGKFHHAREFSQSRRSRNDQLELFPSYCCKLIRRHLENLSQMIPFLAIHGEIVLQKPSRFQAGLWSVVVGV